MDFGASALTAGLISVIVILARVVEHVITKKKNGNGPPICHFPKVQEDILDRVDSFTRKTEMSLEIMKSDISGIKEEQRMTNRSINTLVSSQQRVVDRLGDLIIAMEKNRRE